MFLYILYDVSHLVQLMNKYEAVFFQIENVCVTFCPPVQRVVLYTRCLYLKLL